MNERILVMTVCAALALSGGCAARVATLSEQPKDTVAVYIKGGRRAEFPANTVTKVAYLSSPRPLEIPRQYVLVNVSGEKEDGRFLEPTQLTGIRIDRSAIESAEWQKTIAITKEIPGLRSGYGQMTLMRVFMEGARPDDVLQLSSIKLNDPWEARSGGGGMFRQIGNGDFVLIEHIGSTRRRQGKDPVEIGTLHHRSTLWVEAPTAGTLGVLGDVVLSPCPERQMGRIVVIVTTDSKEPLNINQFQIAPIAVGGTGGKFVRFAEDRTCDTGRIAPGTYKILLPDFDIMKSRWDVNVAPGMVTRLRFIARSQRQVDKIEEAVTADTDGAGGK